MRLEHSIDIQADDLAQAPYALIADDIPFISTSMKRTQDIAFRKAKEIHNMATGTVKWFNATKGYGFIAPENGGNDVFVHISAVEKSGLSGLEEGDKVEFEEQKDRRSGKMSAGNLRFVEG